MADLVKSVWVLSVWVAVIAGGPVAAAKPLGGATRGDEAEAGERSNLSDARPDTTAARPSERRDGFSGGVELGPLVGKAVGYPNKVDKIGERDHRASTGIAPGGMASAWVGGALRDWFNFGVGGSVTRLSGNGLKGDAFAVLFRVEAYPAYSAGHVWRDFSLFANFGAGSMWIMDGPDTQAEGGSMSVIGIGAAHESWRLGHVVVSPVLGYHHMRSASLRSNVGLAAIRVAFYGGP